MATKATIEKEEKKTTPKKVVKKAVTKKKETVSATPKVVKEKKSEEKYVYAVGRRKTAIAQVRLYSSTETSVVVNDKKIRAYFGTPSLETIALSPLKLTGLEESFKVSVVVRGGGLHGQADAIKLGIARCLIKHDTLLRSVLKSAGMLTRDARAVERKKPGLKKARRSPQWAKR